MRYTLSIFLLLSGFTAKTQSIVDSCFTTTEIGVDFPPSDSIANVNSSDLLAWTGTEWAGEVLGLNIATPPPLGGIDCRAVMLGPGGQWTSGGERFGLRLDWPLQSGQTYAFAFTYVSEGPLNEGFFSPAVFTNTVPEDEGRVLVGSLPFAEDDWVTNQITFTATDEVHGHDWLIVGSRINFGGGLVSSFCTDCQDCKLQPFHLGSDTILCTNEPFILDATNSFAGATYQWQNGSTSPMISADTSGQYWVKVVSDECTFTDTINILRFSPPNISLGDDVNFCLGDTVLVDATYDSSEYTWSDGSDDQDLVITEAGEYWVEVTNVCGQDTDTLLVNYLANEVVDFGPDTVICIGSDFLLAPNIEGASYLWQDGSEEESFSVINNGTYWVDVIKNTCSFQDTIEVSLVDSIQLDLGNDTTLCSMNPLPLDATSDSAEYLWQDDSSTPMIQVINEGIYWVEVTNACGSVSDSITIDILIDDDLELGSDTMVCSSSDFLLNASIPGATYLWHDDSEEATFVPTADGDYWVSVFKGDCLIQDTIQINFVNPIQVDLGNDTLICDDDSYILDASSDEAEYMWQDGSGLSFLEVSENGNYRVQVSNICGTLLDSIEVTFENSPLVIFGGDTALCLDQILILGDQEPIQGDYLWQNGSDESFFSVVESGKYWLRIENECGLSTDTIVVSYDSPLDINIGKDSVLCSFDTLTLLSNVNAPEYLWQDGSNQSSLPVLQTDIYWLLIENACGIYSDSVEITVIDPPLINLGSDGILCPGDSILFNVSTDLAEYLWSDFSIEPDFTAYYPEEYWVVVTNQCGTAEDFVEFSCEQVQIPNIFTPNGDGFNDVLLPFTQGDMVSYQFSVHNRWGKELFSTIDRTQSWNGESSPEGLYFAVVTFVNYKGEKKRYTQDVMLKAN